MATQTSDAAPGPQRDDEAPRTADVFVVFGITGDLARVMTFLSLYRLELRGLLDCPVVGVAVDDWDVERLVSAPVTRSSPRGRSWTRTSSPGSRSD